MFARLAIFVQFEPINEIVTSYYIVSIVYYYYDVSILK